MFRRSFIFAIAAVLAVAPRAFTQDIPVVGIANVTFKVSEHSKAKAYYQGVLGMLEAFELKDAAGKTSSVYFKVNDDQFIEVTPTLKPGELVRQARVVFESSDLEKLHSLYVARGLNPSNVANGLDGNPVFRTFELHLKVAKTLRGFQFGIFLDNDHQTG